MRQAQPRRRALRWLEGEERSSALPAAREAVGVSCKLASEGECFIACQLVFPIFFLLEAKCRDSRAGFWEPCASSELLGRAV